MRTVIALLLATAMANAVAREANLVALDPDQVAAFGIETAAAAPVSQAMSKAFPAKVAVPNAQLRVVSAPLAGVVEALLVAEGEAVTAGQVLARIRSTELLALQTAYLEARTRRQLNAETVARERQLRAEGIIAERRLLESEARQRELVNAEERDRQALRLAGMPDEAIAALARQQQLSAVLEVKAPLAGVVLEQLATAGQRLATADPLYRIGHLEPLWLEVHVPLESLGGVTPGSPVELPEQGIEARVITVGRMVHGTDQGVLVRAEVRTGAERLRPGQFVEARIAQGADAGLRVPAAAVVRSGDGDYVFVARPGGFLPVAVTLVARQGAAAVVRGDLAADDQVATRGTAALKAAWGGGSE